MPTAIAASSKVIQGKDSSASFLAIPATNSEQLLAHQDDDNLRRVILSHVPTTEVSVTGQVSIESISSVCSGRYPDDESYEGSVGYKSTGNSRQDSKAESGTVSPSQALSTVTSCSQKREFAPSYGSVTSRDPIKKRKVSLTCLDLVTSSTQETPESTEGGLRLLAQPEDDLVLSPLHSFVRKQIEIFEATAADIAQPSPGRKNSIQKDQVGLRCIHCRGVPFRDRVKRAVCYPTSVARIYHSVNDMKFDHFKSCTMLPPDIREKLEVLRHEDKTVVREKKAKTPGLSSSTAQYYHDSACKLGMIDAGQGVYFIKSGTTDKASHSTVSIAADAAADEKVASPQGLIAPLQVKELNRNGSYSGVLGALTRSSAMPMSSFLPFITPMPPQDPSSLVSSQCNGKSGCVPMAQAEDMRHLNPFHCFVRRHVELFEATEEDVSSPCPGRKARIHLGQVGLRCKSCSHLPLTERVKRSVCYPPSVKGIYHAVSNMKFDHFAICRGLSSEERTEFDALRSVAGRKRSKGGPKITSCSTARYYYESAMRLGLVDTKHGIRFQTKNTPASVPVVVNGSKEGRKLEPVGLSALMVAATDPSLQAAFAKAREEV